MSEQPRFFYAFADTQAALAAGALVGEEPRPAVEGAIILRRHGIAVVPAEVNPETEEVITPEVLSLPLVILSPTMIDGCSDALIVPPGHAGFA